MRSCEQASFSEEGDTLSRKNVDEPGDGTSITPAGDEAAILQVRSGNTEAFAGLYERHVGSALATARGYARNPSDVSDLVSEAFAKVLQAVQSGHGPTVFFRAYLLTTLRRLAMAKRAADEKNVPMDDLESVMGASPHKDPAVTAFEKEVVGKSFKDLPERWQAVLWYSEVDGMTPADMAPIMGISANAVAALALRAREGLKQAYLQNHVSTATAGCSYYAENLGAYARGGLTRRRSAKVDVHLQDCLRCAETLLHLNDVGGGMRSVIFPALVGFSVAGKDAISGSGVAFGLGKAAAFGSKGASAATGAFGTVGLAVTAAAGGLLLVAAVVSAAVVQSTPESGGIPVPSASSNEMARLGGIPQRSAAPSVRPLEPTPSVTESEAAGLPQPEGSRAEDHGAQPQPQLPSSTWLPTLVPTAGPSPSPSAMPTAPTPSPSPEPSATPAPTTAVPSPTPTPEGGGIGASATISRWGFPTSMVRVSLSNASQAELRNATVSFTMPRYWLELALGITGPEDWECVDASSVMMGLAVCTAANWQQGTASFDLTLPTMNIMSGYPMEISGSALGTADFTATLLLSSPN
ncbi:hypothetical protein CVS28_18835 [Arthrobacter glacialis]|nr:hypothetical protein CVS28_18835 [Arthrobacter glacialis]